MLYCPAILVASIVTNYVYGVITMAGATIIDVADFIILAFGELLISILIADNDVAASQFCKFVVVHRSQLRCSPFFSISKWRDIQANSCCVVSATAAAPMERAVFTFPDHRTVKRYELVGGGYTETIGFRKNLDFVMAQLVKRAINRSAIDGVATAGRIRPARRGIVGGKPPRNVESSRKRGYSKKNFNANVHFRSSFGTSSTFTRKMRLVLLQNSSVMPCARWSNLHSSGLSCKTPGMK